MTRVEIQDKFIEGLTIKAMFWVICVVFSIGTMGAGGVYAIVKKMDNNKDEILAAQTKSINELKIRVDELSNQKNIEIVKTEVYRTDTEKRISFIERKLNINF